MTTFEIPKVKRIRPKALAAEPKKVVSRSRRFHSWFRGWRDGRKGLYGPSNAVNFADLSHFLRKVRSHSASLQADCEGKLQEELIRLTELRLKLSERVAGISQTIEELATSAHGIKCERPTATRRSHVQLLWFLFVAEVAFSYLNLMYADMGGFVVEAILSVVFSGCLIGLTRTIGQRYRRLPLSLDEPRAASIKIYIEIAFFSLIMVGVLCGLTYLRARGLRLTDEVGSGETFAEISLFIIGFGFLAYAAWTEGQVEYSGPKYGTAALEQSKGEISDLLTSINGEIENIDSLRETLRDVFSKNIERIRNIYTDQYRRHERPRMG